MCKKVVEGRYVIYRIYLVSRLYGRVNSSYWGECCVYVVVGESVMFMLFFFV